MPPVRSTPLMLIAIGLAALAGCASRAPAPETAPVVTNAASESALAWPVSPQDYRTTSGNLYLGNLDARIDTLQALASKDPDGDASRAADLAASLYHRYRIRGRLEDAERALRWAERAVAAGPSSRALALRAAIQLGLHDFAAAQADLDALDHLEPRTATSTDLRLQLDLALGRYEQLGEELARASELSGDFYRLVLRGNLLVLRGDLSAASRQFRFAQSLYRDVDPMPLAWLHVQQGIALLRFGHIADARRFFAAAHARLPEYALAAEHLAETEALLGNAARARELYLQVIAQTGNPEFMAALAELERSEGETQRAAELQQSALDVYEQWLARHPSAFAQHAAEFFVAIEQAPRALALARQNADLRQDIGSLILLAEAADAAGHGAAACAAWQRVDSFIGLEPPEKSGLRLRLAGRCGA